MSSNNTLEARNASRPPYQHGGMSMSPAGDEGSQPSHGTRRKKSRHVSRACNSCRRKKTRCNGERPTCALCIINNDKCTYDTAQDRRRPVSKAYVAALEDRVAWLEGVLENRGDLEGAGESADMPEERSPGAIGNPPLNQPRPTRPNGKAPQEPVSCLQIDNTTGEVREYGPTSMFKHLPATEASPATSAQSGASPSNSTSTVLGDTTALGFSDSLDDAVHEEILRVFFTFFNPWCWWVDERRFRNDMSVSLPEAGLVVRRSLRTAHYSPLLHFAILAIGVMYLDNMPYANRERVSDSLARDASTFYEEEIETAKLSAVSGLMLLGSHHAGHARQSLGYIYSGSGMRLTRILGLGIDASSWVDKGVISAESKQSRDRVWHNAYIQDKLWSTYVGRAPAPNLSHGRMPFPAIDEEEDARPWHGFDNLSSELNRTSWTASVFTWTCKLGRIVELILTNIYSTRRSAYSDKAQNAKYEICVLLERWHGELPEPLRVNSTLLRSQGAPTTLPHVLVMNMMFHFAVILLNRPDYCDNSSPTRPLAKSQSATLTMTATERCNKSAVKLLRLAELFDRAFGLRYAPVSMTQFMFTAGTIHLLSVANGRSVESDTALVKGSIVVLHSMGQTWKCASQSGDVLQQLLHEWHPKSASTDAAVATGKNVQSGGIDGPSSSSAPQAIDIEQVLQKNPEVAQQLRKLGWAPPELGTVQPSPGLTTTDLETLLTAPNFTQTGKLDTPSGQQSFATPDGTFSDISWMSQPYGWTDHSYTSTLPPIQEQSLLEMLKSNDGTAPEAWSNRLFNAEAGGAWPPGRSFWS